MCIPFCLTGCASAPSRYFSLGGDPAESSAAAASAPRSAAPCLVDLDAASVPAIVDRPQLVLTTAPGQVSIREQARWAAPLRDGLPDALRDAVEQVSGGAIQVRRGTHVLEGLRVEVELERFDLTDKSASLALTFYTSDSTKLRDVHTVHAEEAVASGADREAAAAAAARQAVLEAGRQLESILTAQCQGLKAP